MDNQKFIDKCKLAVAREHNDNVDTLKGETNFIITDDIYVVWLTKALQNNKALLSTNQKDGMYYEITYNGDKKEFYLDAYEKKNNKCIKEEDL